jgi:hypothetical protein
MILAVGDRVKQSGWTFRQEPDRIGTVVRIYNGTRTGVTSGVPMLDVQWDGLDQVAVGYIQSSGSLALVLRANEAPA